jgi:integrase
MNPINYPKVVSGKDEKVYLDIQLSGKRMRVSNGSRFSINLSPNSYPVNERINQANILAAQIYAKLLSGFDPYHIKAVNKIQELSDLDILKKAMMKKVEQGASKHYQTQLKYSLSTLAKNCFDGKVSRGAVEKTLGHFTNPTSYNTMRRGLVVLFNAANEIGWDKNPIKGFKNKRAKAKLNKPIDDVPALLKEIRSYNENLYLCCLLTYGCLLRPHREVRELKWKDFSKDFNHISLSGDRNKSGRNRIVPVPYYVKEVLKKNEDHLNIFSGKEEAFDADYFKGLWSRFKKRSRLLEPDQTLYSFRHTGAIDIYKRTGSIEKLKAAMGHSNIMVSLTYLRGLDVAELQEADMPRIES